MAGEELEDLVEPVEEELEDQQPQGPSVGDRIQDAQDTVDRGKDRLGRFRQWQADRAQKRAAQTGAEKGLREGVEKEGAARAKRRVATQANQQVGKAVEKQALKKGTGLLARSAAEAAIPVAGWVALAGNLLLTFGSSIWKWTKEKGWRWVVGIAGALILILAVVFGLLGGRGAPKYPTTPGEIGQTAIASALSGSPIYDSNVTQASADFDKKRYAIVQKNVDSDSSVSGRSAEVKVKIKEILDLEDQAVALHGDAKKTMVTLINSKTAGLDNSLPFGNWIARYALSQVNQPSQEYCQITHAASSIACASFVTTALENAGAKIPINAAVDNVWRMKALRTIVDRPASRSEGYYSANKSHLQPGDIIFWGDGSCSAGGSVLFDHIGFYVGGDQAVDNSSSAHAIKKRQAAKRDNTCRFFNGAKRYGANL